MPSAVLTHFDAAAAYALATMPSVLPPPARGRWSEKRTYVRDSAGRFSSGGGVAGAAKPGKPGAGTGQAKDRAEVSARLSRIPKGAGRAAGLGTREDPIHVGKDLDKAVSLIAEGKHVRLNQPAQVSTLIDKLAANVEDAKSKGSHAPTYDLGLVTVKGTNLFTQEHVGVARVNMPQLQGKARPGSIADRAEFKDARGESNLVPAFRAELARQGISITNERVPASHLRASQMDLEGGKVAGMAKAIEAGTLKEAPIFVTRDNYIIDGHHRWAANVAVDMRDNRPGDITMPVMKINADIGHMLSFTNEFTHSMGLESAGLKWLHWFFERMTPAPPEIKGEWRLRGAHA